MTNVPKLEDLKRFPFVYVGVAFALGLSAGMAVAMLVDQRARAGKALPCPDCAEKHAAVAVPPVPTVASAPTAVVMVETQEFDQVSGQTVVKRTPMAIPVPPRSAEEMSDEDFLRGLEEANNEG